MAAAEPDEPEPELLSALDDEPPSVDDEDDESPELDPDPESDADEDDDPLVEVVDAPALVRLSLR